MFRKTTMVIAAAGMVASLVASPAQAANEKGTAVIKGKVVFDGTPPVTVSLPAMTADPFCAQANPKSPPDQSTIVYTKQGSTIPYVFVYVKEGSVTKNTYDVPKTPVTIDQKNCTYHPHVFGMIAGQQIDIKSSDNTAHNIHSLPKKNKEFNISQPKPGVMPRTGNDTFTKPENAVKFKCDVHSWMSAWCFVMTHPFFDVTKSHDEFPGKDEKGADNTANMDKWGTFEIKELPAGEYTLEAWHEKYGTVTQKVTVKDGETKQIEFKMSGKKTSALDIKDDARLASVAEVKASCCSAKTATATE